MIRPAAALESRPRLACAAALGFAAAGEAVVRTGHAWYAGAALTLAGALVLAPGAWPAPAAAADARPPVRRGPLLAGGAALAAALAALSASTLWRDAAAAALPLWLLSLGALAATALAAGRGLDVAPRWGVARLPEGRVPRLALLAFAAALLAGAAFVRFWNLGRLPFGVNPDEGDQAALAMQVAGGFNTDGWFAYGWYHLSIVYFKLLAAVMSVAGLDVAGARVFGACCGLATVAVVAFLAVRHFGWRAGLLAATLLSFMGGAIQFSRVTTVASPTQTLWALSAAGFLEAARRGRAWAWGLAGLAGGLSIFFYPTGRLWCLLAIPFSIAVFLRSPRAEKARVAAGVAFAALAAIAAAGPFLVGAVKNPGEFTVRAQETTVFIRENASRLSYVRPEWGVGRLLVAQVEHGLGFFNRYVDQNIVWPTDRPLFPPVFAALVFLGLLAAVARWRDPRLLLATLWFAAGYVGVIVTVETPNMHRSATALPVLPLFAALVLDEAVRRFAPAAGRARLAATAAAAAVAAFCATLELTGYFGAYAKLDRWPFTRVEGTVTAEAGAGGWALTVGNDAHMVNSGWVRLLAPAAHRLGVATPGLTLPLALPAVRDLSFLVYGRQSYYLPYLASVYPGGTTREARHFPNELVLREYRVPLAAWAARRGALVSVAGAPPVRVDAIGDAPPGSPPARAPRSARWSAALRVPRYGNVLFSLDDGVLAVDGREILRARGETREATVALPEGDHRVDVTAPLAAGASFRWQPEGEEKLRRPRAAELWAVDGPPQGLLGTYAHPDAPVQLRLDGTLAAMSLGADFEFDGPWTATWRGTLLAPADGAYAFGFFTHGGTVALRLDGGPALVTAEDGEKRTRFDPVSLARGPHAVEIVYRVVHRPAAIDWIWTPPGGEESVVPPSVLRPPADAGPRPPLSPADLAALRERRRGSPFLFVP